MKTEILSAVDHRPWPLPSGPWTMAQSWHDLLFAHWPVPVEVLQAAIPPPLSVDTFDGAGWLGIVPFRMSGVRIRALPSLPGLSAFPELNVRTYVFVEEKPGVYFFSLDAANPVAVAVARRWFHLPYFRARMALFDDGETIRYRSRRAHRGAPPAELVARYRPAGAVFQAAPGTLERWLTERYALYALDRHGRLFRGDIHHRPWLLQPAQAEFEVNTMAAAHGIALPAVPPLLHFSRRMDVIVWRLQEVNPRAGAVN